MADKQVEVLNKTCSELKFYIEEEGQILENVLQRLVSLQST